MATAAREGLRIEIHGTVQGVGFRPWVYRLARESAVAGLVRNDGGGVTIEAFGEPGALDEFVARLRGTAPPAASIHELRAQPIQPRESDTFEIVASDAVGERRVSIPPDLATCPECAREVFDPGNRRYRYPFTNCTNCGPRFTIARAAPYDRHTTTMAPFRMCAACQREYETVDDRRFHAEPNACPICGPRLLAVRPDGSVQDDVDPIDVAASALRDGRIVAVKGIGGFHLACDATSSAAVKRLRERKHRDEKPFAVMVRGFAMAERLAWIEADERRLLASVERPIVLVTRRTDAGLAPEIAPGNPLVGLLLPYSPLHHLLLAAVDAPLVMTSGNVSDAPLAFTNDEALEKLGGIADLFLVHDREIATPCDDSVTRVIAGRPMLLRRARGYVPRPLRLGHRLQHPVLACGALLKNTFCLAAGDQACLGPHIGDLENLDVYRSYEASVDQMERFLDFHAEVVAHDLHPDYLSTRYALGRSEPITIAVQHHHAHIASAMAEHGLDGPVLGVAYDGAGLGDDGVAWGAEVLVASYASYERLATFRPIPLAGGDAAVRQPWRIALALLDDAFEGDAPIEALALFHRVPGADLDVVRRMIHARVATRLASGMGRYFDGFGALGLARTHATFEGQVALEWNLVADAAVHEAYPCDLDGRGTPWVVDLRPTVRAAVGEILGGERPGVVSAKFHNTIARATAEIVRRGLREAGRLPVVLTGGCFQNARLTESVIGALGDCARVYTHQAVPPGDGGIALGQALVADAVAGT